MPLFYAFLSLCDAILQCEHLVMTSITPTKQGRAESRNKARKLRSPDEVLQDLQSKGIAIKIASKHLVTEEAPESYKDVTAVVDTCHAVGVSKKAFRLRPIAVIKG